MTRRMVDAPFTIAASRLTLFPTESGRASTLITPVRRNRAKPGRALRPEGGPKHRCRGGGALLRARSYPPGATADADRAPSI